MSLPGILRLPTEVLVSIFELKDLHAKWEDAGSIPSIRLTCRRFCALSSHLLIRKVYVDITQSETIERFAAIAANSALAKGVREVYVRVHFYHPWVAATFKNFVESVKSEWRQRTSSEAQYYGEHHNEGDWDFNQIAWNLIRRYAQISANAAEHSDSEENPKESDSDARCLDHVRPNLVLQRAYKLYKAGHESQSSLMQNGNFTSLLSNTLSNFPDLSYIAIYDRALRTNANPGSGIYLSPEDHAGQEDVLVSVLSRPMLWEDAQWIQPAEKIRPGVPVELLVEIPLAVGKAKDIFISYLGIEVTTAPDYTRLPTDPETLKSLTAAMKSVSLFQLVFSGRCCSGCGPWTSRDDDEDDSEDAERPSFNTKPAAELQALGQYIGALLDCESLQSVEISLDEFWIGAGFDSIHDAPASLGANWYEESANVHSLHLREVSLNMQDVERIINNAMADPADEDDEYSVEIYLDRVYLCEGTWKQVLDTLRTVRRDNIQVSLKYPVGGGLAELDDELYSSLFQSDYPEESVAEKYIKGEIDLNPLGRL